MQRTILETFLRRLALASTPLLLAPGCSNTPLAGGDGPTSDLSAPVVRDLAVPADGDPLNCTNGKPDLGVLVCGSHWRMRVDGGVPDGFTFGCPACGNINTCAGGSDECGPFVDCFIGCTGRRPPTLARSGRAARGDEVARFFGEMARLEAASVDAFRLLGDELRLHRAPRALLAAAARAATDEVRHARVTAALARRFGGSAPRPRLLPRPAERRPLVAIAVENAVEGCVREGFGALVATHQARAARDSEVRAAFARLAVDETRHAALAFAVDAWAATRLDARDRRVVREARRHALDHLLAPHEPPPRRLAALAGLPSPVEERALAEGFARSLA